MSRPARLAALLVVAGSLLGWPAAVPAGEPPNQNDPCSEGGRNTCGTLGVGFYDTYRYGLRWFGDFRGAVPDVRHTFCIDLQYWYPSPSYRYREVTADTLRNRDGELVPLESRRRMAYAMWAWGRSGDPVQQAAVMLYVHGLMGDARPGEVDPAGVSDTVAAVYAQVARDAARLHGPYRVVVDAPSRLRVGEEGTATIRVLSASGAALPNVTLRLTGEGAGVPESASTGADGVARVAFTAKTVRGATISVRTEPIASTLPVVHAPTTPAAAVNGQRLAAPSSQVVTGSAETSAYRAQVRVSSVAVPSTLALGEASRDRVVIAGVDESYRVVVTARLYGPFRSTGAIRCDGKPAWEGKWETAGSGEYMTPAVPISRPGWYVYRHYVPGDAGHAGTLTTCTDPRERVKAIAAPTVATQVSPERLFPGGGLTDAVVVEGLGGETATIRAALYGPFGNRESISCDGTPAWTGTVEAKGDGEYRTGAFKPGKPGYYTYRVSLAASEFVPAVEAPCGEDSETAVVAAAPQVRTQVSDARVRPGAELRDRVIVTGAGSVELAVSVALYGPFATRGAISCSATPYWRGTVAALGDGTYTTEPVTVDRVGYYTFRESIAAAPQTAAFAGKCAAQSETTLVTAAPRVSTVVSADVVLPGGTISDEISVVGLGRSEARIAVELFGPFPTRAAIRCSGEPFDRSEVYAKGDGTVTTRPVRVREAGFYAYRERLVGTDLIEGTTGECGLVAETALSRPAILTGRNEATGLRRWAAADPRTPVRVRVASLGIDAPVSPVGIDVREGALDVPPAISRLGWWLDGQLAGSQAGAMLIAGHVDSARAGPGALFRLHEARVGDRIQVTARNGRTFAYRVTSVRTMPKAQLPADVYSRTGRPRVVLVTCGGPFDSASGHYRDNVVVTAAPV